jgi:hypothetical protein
MRTGLNRTRTSFFASRLLLAIVVAAYGSKTSQLTNRAQGYKFNSAGNKRVRVDARIETTVRTKRDGGITEDGVKTLPI